MGLFGIVALGFGALIGLLQISQKLNALSKNIDLYSSVLGIIAIGGSILLDLLNQHYKIKDSSQPANSADAEDRTAD